MSAGTSDREKGMRSRRTIVAASRSAPHRQLDIDVTNTGFVLRGAYPGFAVHEMLANRTIFVTGGSRGIGLAIAKRAARDGANVVIAAKSATPHPKLPGTIYTAAKECEVRFCPA